MPAAAVSDRFFRQLVWSMRNGVIAVTRDGALAVMNDEAYRIFGLQPDPADIGRQYSDVLRPHPDIVRVLASAFELSHLPNRAELRLKKLGRVIGYTLSLVRDLDGEVIGAALFFKDLTRVEQLEERERLRDRLAALGEMAAAIAHELKNPLAGIEVMAGLLRRKVPQSPDAQSILTDIINEAKMANTTVVEVLDYVRPVRLETERTSLADVLHDSVTMAESKARRGSVSVDLRVPADLPDIQGDRHQLCQVFTNLIVNAFEALDGKGSITITAEQGVMDDYHNHPGDHPAPSPAVIVQIADDGPGVPPEMADRIFNAFFTTKAQGSGLGLAIVRKIVDAHDGRIDVSSAPGHGTRFTVTLPVAGRPDWFQ
ncbi:MAG TPA: ATP-binding protein [Vicinamibacterales bacterium]|nr:ATP-binding protein [Vicinamibacterales bacterium]